MSMPMQRIPLGLVSTCKCNLHNEINGIGA